MNPPKHRPPSLSALAAAILPVLLITSCTAPPKPVSDQERLSVETVDQARAGGLTLRDMEAVHAMLRFVFNQGSRRQECVMVGKWDESQAQWIRNTRANFSSVWEDPLRLELSNSKGLRLGILYSRATDSLWLLDTDKLGQYRTATLEKSPKGYLFTVVDGCVITPFEVSTSKGRPFTVRLIEDL